MPDGTDFVLELGKILKGFADKDQTPEEAHAAGAALSALIGNAKLRITGPAGERDALWMEDQDLLQTSTKKNGIEYLIQWQRK